MCNSQVQWLQEVARVHAIQRPSRLPVLSIFGFWIFMFYCTLYSSHPLFSFLTAWLIPLLSGVWEYRKAGVWWKLLSKSGYCVLLCVTVYYRVCYCVLLCVTVCVTMCYCMCYCVLLCVIVCYCESVGRLECGGGKLLSKPGYSTERESEAPANRKPLFPSPASSLAEPLVC